MQPIDALDLRTFDLNLLVALDALMRERSVTRAAERMHVGQPAMSHSLAMLRALLQDELLVRVGNVMEPTQRALRLHGQLVEGLAALQTAVKMSSETFDPTREQRTFRLGYSSDVELALMPSLAARLVADAPGIRVVGHLFDGKEIERALDDGRLDLAVGCFAVRGSRFSTQKLYDQELRCMWHPDQLSISLPLTREQYLSSAHAIMTLDDNLQGCLDAGLTAIGASLNVIAASAQFLSVLAMVASGPILATLPSNVARLHCDRFGLLCTTLPLPLSLPPILLVWSTRLNLDPGAVWLRTQIIGILSVHTPLPEMNN